MGVIHTDLKPENVMASRPLFPYKRFVGDVTSRIFNCLEDDPCTIDFKLGDIGNSCFLGFPLNDLIQTRQYRAPEVLLGLPYGTSADMWSLACMAFELATRHYLFQPSIDDSDTETSENHIIIDAIHLSMIEEVVGAIPMDWAREGMQYDQLYQDGKLIARHHDHMPCVFDLLVRFGVCSRDASELAEFLENILAIIPSQRATAEEMWMSPFLHHI
jgi:serine/threonine protein kinase